jgi:hypothetical protein
MLRFIYLWLVRLHPSRFKKRFGDEMLSIFDQTGGKTAATKLIGDGAISVLRQWITPPEFGEKPLAATCVGTSDGTPNLYTVDDSLPQTRALVNGTALSLAVFSLICLWMIYDQTHVVLRPLFSSPIDSWGPPLPKERAIQPGVARRRRFENQPATQASSPQKAPTTQPATMHKERVNQAAAQSMLPRRTASPKPIGRREFHAQKLRTSPLSPPLGGRTKSTVMLALVDVPRRALRSYAGTYIADMREGLNLSVKLESEELIFEVPGEQRRALLPVSETDFLVKDAPDCWVEFSKNQDGTLQLDFYENDRHISARRLPDKN